jgi:PKD repeat protein
MLLASIAYGQQEQKRADIDRLWEVLTEKGTANLRRQTTVKQLQELATGFTDCRESKGDLFSPPTKTGKDCSTIDKVNHMLTIYNFKWDKRYTWNAEFGTHVYGSYDDKLFYIQGDNGPAFTFEAPPRQEEHQPDCMFGSKDQNSWYTIIIKSENVPDPIESGNSKAFTPNKADVGKKITLEHIFHKYNKTSCQGSGIEPDDHYKTSTIRVEPPHWIESKKQELASICNDYGTINIFNCFSLSSDDKPITSWSDEVLFYLDDVQLKSNNLDINSLKPGIHTLAATKVYDNGIFKGELQFTVRPVTKITFGEYRKTVCVSEPLRTITAFADGKKVGGGIWSGEGMDVHGNFEPTKAGVGNKKLTYTYKNPQGCTSSADIFIDVKPLPAQASITGKASGCIGDVITLTASTSDATNFGWFYKDQHAHFYEGATITRTITGDEELYVRSISENRCYSAEKTPIQIKSFTPFGRIANTIPKKDAIRQGASLGFKFIPEETREYTYAWDFGDGETSSEKEPIHFFSKAGEFTVKVLVEDIEKCQNTITYENKIKVDEFPHWITKTASLNNSCNNIDPIDIFDYFSLDERHVKITDFSGIKFHLDNDTELSSNIIDITSLSPGIHKVTASKTYPSKKFEEYFTFKIKPSPQITFGEYQKGICQTEPTFLIPVLVDGKKAAGGIWTGLGIDPAGYFNPKEAGLGVKKLSYSFTNKEGCTETEEIDIDVRAVPATPIITGKTTGCISEVITLKASALNASQFAWYKTGEVEPFFHGDKLDYTIIKTEELYVKALNSEFCPSTSSLPISITCFAPLGKISTTENTIKQHEMLSFTFHPADGTQAKEYLWNFGDGFKSTKAGVTQHYYNKAGTFTVTLKVQSPEGCDNIITYEKQIKVEEIHTPETEKPTFPPYVATPKTPLKLNVFPNPFKDWIKLTVDSPIDDVAYVRMYNQNGWLMYQKTLDIKKGENEIVLNDFQNLTTIIWNLKIDAKSFNINEIFLKED